MFFFLPKNVRNTLLSHQNTQQNELAELGRKNIGQEETLESHGRNAEKRS